MVVPIALAACGSGRNYDNPPEVAPLPTAGSTTTTATTPPTTAFVPSTAPTTLAPPTAPLTIPPTNAPPPTPAPTPAPTQATVPTTPVVTTGETYTVVVGDTLFGISRRLGVTLPALLSANGLTETSLITPGETLGIPVGGSAPTAPPATNAPAATDALPATNAPGTNAPATDAPVPTDGGPAPGPTATFPAPAGAVVPQQTQASCQADDSEEADGTEIVFSPGNVLDRNPATAWRCPAPATGESLTFTLAGSTQLTSVGLIGGYVKVDATTGVDRFIQNHRIRQVRWTFSDGTSVTQDLADSRQMQTITVDVTTTTVTMEILSTYPPGGPAPRQMVPVAEVQLIGTPA